MGLAMAGDAKREARLGDNPEQAPALALPRPGSQGVDYRLWIVRLTRQ